MCKGKGQDLGWVLVNKCGLYYNYAKKMGLKIVPVINKVDLPAADVDGIKTQIQDFIGLDASNAVSCSAKTGFGIQEILDHIITDIPCPAAPADDILRALIFDSHYDVYRGVYVYIRVMSGEVTKGSLIKMMATGKTYELLDVGIFTPSEKSVEKLRPGEVGYIIANIKNPADVKIGDTITLQKHPAAEPLPGFKTISPVVFAGIYPIDTSDFELLRDALAKLQLNDSALLSYYAFYLP